jgi:hypothetical protein
MNNELNLINILNNTPFPICITDLETCEVLFLNKSIKEIWDIDLGDTCFKKLNKNQTSPCEFCINDKELKTTQKRIVRNSINNRWYEKYYNIIKWNNRLVRIVMLVDITDKKLFNSLMETNNLLSSLMLESNNIDLVINTALSSIGNIINCSRVYVFEFENFDSISLTPNSRIIQKYEWCAKEFVIPLIENEYFSNLTLKNIGWERLFNILKSNTILNEQTKNIKNKKEKEHLEAQDIKSILCIPIYLKNNILYGFIGFDECVKEDREWTHIEVHALRILANDIGLFVDRCDREQRLSVLCEKQATLLNNLDFYVWYFKNPYTYGYINRAYKDYFIGVNKEYKIKDCHNDKEANILINATEKVFESNQPITIENWFTNAFNEERYLSIRQIPIVDKESNEVNSVLCIAYDLTEQYLFNNKILTDFSKKIDDDFRELQINLTKSIERLNV